MKQRQSDSPITVGVRLVKNDPIALVSWPHGAICGSQRFWKKQMDEGDTVAVPCHLTGPLLWNGGLNGGEVRWAADKVIDL